MILIFSMECIHVNPYIHCFKSPSVRGFVACLPVRLLFKSIKHNAFYPVLSTQFKCRNAAMTKPGKMHSVIRIIYQQLNR